MVGGEDIMAKEQDNLEQEYIDYIDAMDNEYEKNERRKKIDNKKRDKKRYEYE